MRTHEVENPILYYHCCWVRNETIAEVRKTSKKKKKKQKDDKNNEESIYKQYVVIMSTNASNVQNSIMNKVANKFRFTNKLLTAPELILNNSEFHMTKKKVTEIQIY